MNLLGPDIIAELTIHLLSDGSRKSIVSKIEDAPGFQVRQQVIQALIFTAVEIAKEREIGINWQALGQMYPYRGPAAAMPAPAPAPPQ